jgi:hypothetical protein
MNKQWIPLICTAFTGVALAQGLSVSAPPDVGATNSPVSLGSTGSRFKHLDKNHNGSLSAEEMNSMRGSSASSSSAVHFDQMDTNRDDKISAAEYAAGDARMKFDVPSAATPVE